MNDGTDRMEVKCRGRTVEYLLDYPHAWVELETDIAFFWPWRDHFYRIIDYLAWIFEPQDSPCPS